MTPPSNRTIAIRSFFRGLGYRAGTRVTDLLFKLVGLR